jgi:hypothetical protein
MFRCIVKIMYNKKSKRLGEVQLQLLRRESLPTSQTLKMPTDSGGDKERITSPFTLGVGS